MVFVPKKTSYLKNPVEVTQPLDTESRELLEEVNYNTSVYGTSNQKYNKYMLTVTEKLIEKYPHAEFRKKYTSHNMRDTFISICVLSNVNFKSILLWVGQSSYAIMDRYIELTSDFNRQEMNKTQIQPDKTEVMQELMAKLRKTDEDNKYDVDIEDIPM